MSQFADLMRASRPYLTDGGMETWLFFQQGFSAPEFAAVTLIEDKAARKALTRYFDEFLEMAAAAGTGYVLDTNTWRGCPVWAEALGMSGSELLRLDREAIRFAAETRDRWLDRVPHVVLNGVIGPAGDGYAPGHLPTSEEALEMHRAQIRLFSDEGVDMISAITMTNIGEAIGITRAAREAGLPVVVSFTVETDGRLPTGDLLGEAIAGVDAATDGYPAYYMINCAHPAHFRDVLSSGEQWVNRIGGLRANASRMSHEELDNSEALDQGDPEEFGQLHGELARMLPNLRVVGGCCGTDHRHVRSVSRELHVQAA